MLSDEGIGAIGSVTEVRPACVSGTAGRDAEIVSRLVIVRGARRGHPAMGVRRVLGLALARGALSAALASLLPLHAAIAQETVPTGAVHAFEVPAGDLALALEAFGAQSGIHPEYPPGLVNGKRAQAVRGQMGWREALNRLLLGSGLAYGYADGRVVITARTRETTGPAPPSASADSERAAPQAQPEATDLASITVTGTRIRGGTAPSPVITIGAEHIREAGFTDLGEVIRSVPQNFSGGQNPGVVSATGSGNTANQDVTGGSGLNLRGAGGDATLTLLNGRRRSYGGIYDSVDISAIPVEAVDRIEIVADGASAIYGSDAVAGVGNVILRRDFDGVRVGTRYGAATDGGLATREYSGTTGATWDSGGFIASVKRVVANPVDVRQRPYTEAMAGPHSLFPGSTLQTGVFSGHQSVGSVAEFRVDVLRSRRHQAYYQRHPAFWYDNQYRNTTFTLSPTVEFALPGGWDLSVGGAQSKDENEYEIWTVTAASGAGTLARAACNCNESRLYEVSGEGPLFATGSGEARLAVGVGARTNRFLNQFRSEGIAYGGDEVSRFGYAELNLPLRGRDSAGVTGQGLSVTAALRAEDYDNFGSVVTPKAGVVYKPNSSWTTKASWGRSFKAPMLSSRFGSRFVYLVPAALAGGVGYPGDATALITWGANPDLQPERARTMTASLAFHPQALPGLEAELTLFDIDYRDRVLAPLAVISQALSAPAFADFVEHSPSAERQAAVLAGYERDIENITGAPYDPANVVAIAYNHNTNALRQRLRGVDLSGSYRFDAGPGRLTLRAAASLLDSTQQNTPGQGEFDLSGTIFYPAKVNGRAGVVWAAGGLTASAFANYTSGVTDHLEGRKGGSFTTFDATLRYETSEGAGGGNGWEFVLAGQNLLNRAPPLYMPWAGAVNDVPFDSTNYTAMGRFLSVSIAKHW